MTFLIALSKNKFKFSIYDNNPFFVHHDMILNNIVLYK